MLVNTLKNIMRTLSRDRLYASINIVGLALAVASCLILGLYLYSELTYDRHHLKHQRIYRVADAFQDYDTGNQRRALALTSPVLGPLLKKDFAEVEAYVRVQPLSDAALIRHGDEALYWDKAFYADASIFDVFTHKVLYGDPHTALVDPLSVAISEKVATAYFGKDNPLGKTLVLNEGDARTVSLVFANLPDNTHLKYDVLFSYNHPSRTIDDTAIPRQLFGVNTYTYLLMPENYNPMDFAVVARTFYQRYMETLARERTNRAWSGWLQPLGSIHLGEDLLNDEPTGNRFYLYGFAAVAVFILLIAAINYINLATAGYFRRAREVAIRKILGEGRTALVLQFLGESALLVLVALMIGVVVVEVALSEAPLTVLLGKVLSLNIAEQPALFAALLGTGLLFSVLAGLYPALHLSSVRPLDALGASRKFKAGKGELRLREALILLQFTISIAVIACTLVMVQQMRFVAGRSLGFDKDNRVLVTLRDANTLAQLPVLQDELRRNPGVVGVSYSTSMMGQEVNVNSTSIQSNDGSNQPVQLAHMAVADNFIDVMHMKLLTGRNFSAEVGTDAAGAVLVNQSLVDYMHWDQPLGKTLKSTWGTTGTVIGVVADFNFRSLHTKVEPFFLYQPKFSNAGRLGRDRLLVVNISGNNVAATLDSIKTTLAKFAPGQPFEYSFLDSKLDQLYLSEQRLIWLTAIFAGICIAITCLGLFGLTTFTTEQRTREIGIRKVLGATRAQVLLLLFNKTLWLALAGTGLAAAIAWPVMHAWLAKFAWRIEITPLVFLLSAAVVLAISCITMIVQTLRIVGVRPVQTLRYE